MGHGYLLKKKGCYQIHFEEYVSHKFTITQIDHILINAVHNLVNNLRRFIQSQRLPFFW